MATMVCHPRLDSKFIETPWPHINFNSNFPPSLQFAALNSRFLDLDSPESLTPSNNLNHNATDSVLPPSDDNAAIAEPKSPMDDKELESESESESYVHPLVKRSRSTLDEKSLAICTENLGSETGEADFVEDSVFSNLKTERSPTRKRGKLVNNKLFPPPLTTIAGPDSICVRSYREDGRLVMAAVESPSRFSYFLSDRSHGRFRLSILRSCEVESEEEEESAGNGIEIRNDDVEGVGEDGNYEEDVGGKVEENRNGGAEIEMEKFERPCRCNEAGENNNNNVVENKKGSEMLLLTRVPLSIWVST